jgi:hypothetical protein
VFSDDFGFPVFPTSFHLGKNLKNPIYNKPTYNVDNGKCWNPHSDNPLIAVDGFNAGDKLLYPLLEARFTAVQLEIPLTIHIPAMELYIGFRLELVALRARHSDCDL